ncbi:protoporphyrinogen oxidase [Glaciihabitans sp. UYNi722]|uniref:protoporphyrinogen oxidase n=1 Tax=Glaciihabitans sp. UYNi722 TaxID=3156344 RepID=UPI0033939734
MRSKLPLLVGLALGFVLGARAGRERYEQIRGSAARLWESPAVRRRREEVESYARQQVPVIRARAESLAKAAPGAISEGARTTASTARNVAERTATLAKDVSQTVTHTARDVAGKTATTAGDVAERAADVAKDAATLVTDTADDVRDRVTATASELRDRGEEVGAQIVARASSARDDALAEIDDEDDR